MIKITKTSFHFILKVVMVLAAAGIGLYTGFSKSESELPITNSHAYFYFSPPVETLDHNLSITKINIQA